MWLACRSGGRAGVRVSGRLVILIVVIVIVIGIVIGIVVVKVIVIVILIVIMGRRAGGRCRRALWRIGRATPSPQPPAPRPRHIYIYICHIISISIIHSFIIIITHDYYGYSSLLVHLLPQTALPRISESHFAALPARMRSAQ